MKFGTLQNFRLPKHKYLPSRRRSERRGVQFCVWERNYYEVWNSPKLSFTEEIKVK
jgi:hypothetical protein